MQEGLRTRKDLDIVWESVVRLHDFVGEAPVSFVKGEAPE